MFKFVTQFFTALSVLFQAAEKGAKALDHVATVTEEKAANWAEVERIKNKRLLAEARKELEASEPPKLSAA
jgi:hypothetical protein